MERQKKPWSEMTEEEHQAIRESWKHTLPEEFDVYCIGDLILTDDLHIPGNLYVSCDVDTKYAISVSGDFFVGGDIDADDTVTVGSNFIVIGDVSGLPDINIGRDFIAHGDLDVSDVTVHGDLIVRNTVDSGRLEVAGFFGCFDVNSNGWKIHSTDYVCRRYKEENK